MPVESEELVIDRSFDFEWNGGFAVSQKQKNVDALHAAARDVGIAPMLEVSSKSREQLGVQLSAFNLPLETPAGFAPVEVAFQASKVYEYGGPYDDMYWLSPVDARRDQRHQSSGRLMGFRYRGHEWSLGTGSLFYDSLYLRALRALDDSVELNQYVGFTDIEFNPKKSLNCQARSCALFVALSRRGLLDDALGDLDVFIEFTDKYVEATIASNPSVPAQDRRQQFDGLD